jgi:catechol 2,3-dioxygenase-like lactoylglutathione lyase family enzyme
VCDDHRVRGREDSDDIADRWSRSDWWGVVLDAPDARAPAHFYADLLGWELSRESDDDCALAPRDGVAYLATQTAAGYRRPTWPDADGRQQMMLHLDFEVSDLPAAVAHAVELGAELAQFQPQENVRVLLDPAGHPFCLYRS